MAKQYSLTYGIMQPDIDGIFSLLARFDIDVRSSIPGPGIAHGESFGVLSTSGPIMTQRPESGQNWMRANSLFFCTSILALEQKKTNARFITILKH